MTAPQSEHKAASVPESVSTIPPGTDTTMFDAVIHAPRTDLATGVLGVVDSAPLVIPKKKRNTHHWKAIARVAQGVAAERQAMLDDLALKRECDRHAADLETSGLRNQVRFWRLVSLALALFGGLAVALLARVLFG